MDKNEMAEVRRVIDMIESGLVGEGVSRLKLVYAAARLQQKQLEATAVPAPLPPPKERYQLKFHNGATSFYDGQKEVKCALEHPDAVAVLKLDVDEDHIDIMGRLWTRLW